MPPLLLIGTTHGGVLTDIDPSVWAILEHVTARSVAVLAFDGVRLLDTTAVLEVFSTAAALGGDYRITLCSPTGEPVTTNTATRLTVESAYADVARAHTVIVPGSPLLTRRPVPPELLGAIDRLAGSAQRVASVCAGAFALAQTGLLDGRRATTHWRHAARLARAYPAVQVEPDRIYIRDGDVFTSAGVSAGIDLSLALVEADHGAEVAREVARDLVVFLQRPGGQSQFSAASRLPRPRRDGIRALSDAVVADPAADHSAAVLAARAGMSVRHLTRLFREEFDITPAAFVDTVRLEAAQAMLDAGESVGSAASRAGFGSDETMRRAFLRHLGITPSDFRRRFHTASCCGS